MKYTILQKKAVALLLLIGSIIAICSALTTATDNEAITLTPNNCIIATDIDDVILVRNKLEMSKVLLSNPIGLSDYLITCYSYKKSNVSMAICCGERLYIGEVQKYNRETYGARFVKQMSLCKDIMPETFDLYTKLHEQGFIFYTATNIGTLFFEGLKLKFPQLFNEQFIKDGLTINFSVEDVIKKPELRFFEALKAKIDPQGKKYIIFIDDKEENVDAARDAGLIAIHFINAEQLEKELARYGITTHTA